MDSYDRVATQTRLQISPTVIYYLRKVLRQCIETANWPQEERTIEPTTDINSLFKQRYRNPKALSTAIATLERLVQYHQVLCSQGHQHYQELRRTERDIVALLQEEPPESEEVEALEELPGVPSAGTVVRVSDRGGDDQGPLNMLLRQRGYTVQTLSATYLNPAIVEASQADLILLDMMMPDRGADLCHLLKSHGGTQGLPIMMVSAVHSAADRAKAFKAGVVDYITQPAPPDEIVVRMETHLSISRHCRQLEGQMLALKASVESYQAKGQEDLMLLELMQQVLNRQGDYGLLIDDSNRIVYVNGAAAAALGYSREMLLSMGMEQIDLRLTEQDWTMVWQHLREYRTLFLESVHTCQAGTTLAVQLDLQHLQWGDRAYSYMAVQKR